MAAVGSRKTAPPPRKPSPERGGTEELTFRQKLDEIKRQRSSGAGVTAEAPSEDLRSRMNRPEEPLVAKQVQTLTGMKTFLKSFGDWVEVVSKSGKVYYYNKKSLVNQWTKPVEWLAEEVRLNPPLPQVCTSTFLVTRGFMAAGTDLCNVVDPQPYPDQNLWNMSLF